jgi:hypothetical protein
VRFWVKKGGVWISFESVGMGNCIPYCYRVHIGSRVACKPTAQARLHPQIVGLIITC